MIIIITIASTILYVIYGIGVDNYYTYVHKYERIPKIFNILLWPFLLFFAAFLLILRNYKYEL